MSERTTEGLAAQAKSRLLGRADGSRGKAKLDGKEEEIQMLLEQPPGLTRRQWDRVRPLLVIALVLLSVGLVVKWLRGW